MKFLAALLAAILVVALFWWRRRKSRAQEEIKAGARDLTATTSKFHAVSIRPGPSACAAARGLEGQRFLSEAAPPVPLPGCDSLQCRCRFVHFADRRAGDDRRSPFPSTIGLDTRVHGQEQRDSRERRQDPPDAL